MLSIDLSTTSGCTLNGSTVTFPGAGRCVVDAKQYGNAHYAVAPQVQQTFFVSGSVTPPPPPSNALTITTSSLPTATPGTRYDIALGATMGNPPYKWSMVTGTLPPGLHLRARTGTIFGRTARSAKGTYTFTIKVLDRKVKRKGEPATQNTAVKVLSITIS